MITSKIGHSHPLDIITKLNKTERGKMRKNIITLSLENIKSFSKNITSHFTGKEKIIILVSLNIMLSFTNIINTSALSYQSSVGVGFTFNPTLSVNISPSDLVIPNLTPGTTDNSNIINVSVATNAAYGYTLSAIVNGNNSNLTHSNGTNVFSSIATDADLADLDNSEDTNIWGYSYKDNTVVSSTWSNYNGLSSSDSTALINTNSNVSSNLDFKIAAKASNTQASGTYTGVINFTAVTKLTPMNLAESYFAAGKTRYNGYYAMQDMTTEICNNTEVIGEGSQTELIDLRDDKVYWATKLADGHCWMTRNLDLDLDSNRTYTHWDTDLGWSDSSNLDTNAAWKPDNSTINFSDETINDWYNSYAYPRSANPGEKYIYPNSIDVEDPTHTSLVDCTNELRNVDRCLHYHLGNYYNWAAATANNAIAYVEAYEDALNSICPMGWRLPVGAGSNNTIHEFEDLISAQDINSENFSVSLIAEPLYFTKAGEINRPNLTQLGQKALYLSSTGNKYNYAFMLIFDNETLNSISNHNRSFGQSVRCLAR